MFRILFLLLLLVPAIELYFLIKVGGMIGALPTILLTIFTAVVGATLMRSQGLMTLQRAQQAMMMGQLPQTAVIEGGLIFLGGLLLLIPGLITDFIGFLLLIPPLRQAIAARVLNNGLNNGRQPQTYDGTFESNSTQSSQPPGKIEIIEAEWTEIKSDKKEP
ncbi:FxsA family protein [Galenea microaerophila]